MPTLCRGGQPSQRWLESAKGGGRIVDGLEGSAGGPEVASEMRLSGQATLYTTRTETNKE